MNPGVKRWSTRAPTFFVLGRSPGALSPFGTLDFVFRTISLLSNKHPDIRTEQTLEAGNWLKVLN